MHHPPYRPHRPPAMRPRRIPAWSWIVGGTLTGIVTIMLVALCSTRDAPKPRPKPKANAPTTQQQLKLRLQREFLAGLARINPALAELSFGVVATIVQYRPAHRTLVDTYRAGVLVEIKVWGSAPFKTDPTAWTMKGADNGIYDPVVMFQLLKPALKRRTVEPGETVAGWLTFEVPEGFDIRRARLRRQMYYGPSRWMPIGAAEMNLSKAENQRLDAAVTNLVMTMIIKYRHLGLRFDHGTQPTKTLEKTMKP